MNGTFHACVRLGGGRQLGDEMGVESRRLQSSRFEHLETRKKLNRIEGAQTKKLTRRKETHRWSSLDISARACERRRQRSNQAPNAPRWNKNSRTQHNSGGGGGESTWGSEGRRGRNEKGGCIPEERAWRRGQAALLVSYVPVAGPTGGGQPRAYSCVGTRVSLLYQGPRKGDASGPVQSRERSSRSRDSRRRSSLCCKKSRQRG